jgi:hypothetical protein
MSTFEMFTSTRDGDGDYVTVTQHPSGKAWCYAVRVLDADGDFMFVYVTADDMLELVKGGDFTSTPDADGDFVQAKPVVIGEPAEDAYAVSCQNADGDYRTAYLSVRDMETLAARVREADGK